MKQYTTPEQTAKLIELGFADPKTKLPFEVANDELGYTYSIGELIEMLPKNVKSKHFEKGPSFYLAISYLQSEQWYVDYETCDSALFSFANEELVDALYDMILKLRKEGII